MDAKEKFIYYYNQYIKREGADKLLEFLTAQSDFFTAPASARFHGDYEGGLVEHSVNVYECLVDYLSRERAKNEYKMEYSDETVAIVALLHDVCKVNCYTVEYRNAKNERGEWEKVPYFKFDDPLPYGHGEKSVYVVSGFMRLTREEAFAIRYHMGFANVQAPQDITNVGKSFEMFPLAFATAVADMEATYFIEGSKK